MKLTNVKNLALIAILLLSTACNKNVKTTDKADFLFQFNDQYNNRQESLLSADSLTVYIDYTKGLTLRLQTAFFWEKLRPIFVNKAQSFYSIKGQDVTLEEKGINVINTELKDFENPNLDKALKMIVNDDKEAVLVTDAELPDPQKPFLKDAFKTWLLKGFDVMILVEPYEEKISYTEKIKKNMFYFFFFDPNMEGNIAETVLNRVKLEHFPKITKINLAGLPTMQGLCGINANKVGHSNPNDFVRPKVTRKRNAEVQEWQSDWNEKIKKYILETKNEKDKILIKDLKVDLKSMGGWKITDVDMEVFNINEEYTNFYEAFNNGKTPDENINPEKLENFIKMDKKLFNKDGIVNLSFADEINLDGLNGKPYNYIMICFYVKGLEGNVSDYKEKLIFDDVVNDGYKNGMVNVAVYNSVEQTVNDEDVKKLIDKYPFYTIFIQSLDVK